MGQFNSAPWIIGFCMYFFFFYLIVASIVLSGEELNQDMSDIHFNDPGFQTQLSPVGGGGYCGGSTPAFCSLLGWNSDNVTCNLVSGCYHNGDICAGFPSFLPFSPEIGEGGCESIGTNETACTLYGCDWVAFATTEDNSFKPTDAVDISTVTKVLGMMSGFDVELGGMPGNFAFIFYFVFFWIPLLALFLAIYFALPFLH